MIRYEISLEEIHARIEQRVPGWLERARQRVEDFRNKGAYCERSSVWGEIKPVIMEIQGNKCCFCERKMASGSLGRHELDMEHFRPKRTGRKTPRTLLDGGGSPASRPGANQGYYLLAYHVLNYAVACKPCNSGLKKNYFPISGTYDFGQDDPQLLADERALLIYPIGMIDVDPEDVITFFGIMPQSTSEDPFLKRRGQVVIAFFGLDDLNGRKDLFLQRANLILVLHTWLKRFHDDGCAATWGLIEAMISARSGHANCARSFVRQFQSDPATANEMARQAEDFVSSRS